MSSEQSFLAGLQWNKDPSGEATSHKPWMKLIPRERDEQTLNMLISNSHEYIY